MDSKTILRSFKKL